MLDILGEIIRAALAHSECVALFAILLIQQWAMHLTNTRKIDSVPRKVEEQRQEHVQSEKEDAASRR